MPFYPVTTFPIESNGPISRAFRHQGINSFLKAVEWTHKLPYGRNSDRKNTMQMFDEGRGTCSTKHALLAALCSENGVQTELMLAICKLNRQLEPKVASLLDQLGVDFFPEAHCYLRYEGHDIDITFPDQPPILKAEVLQTHTIHPEQIGDHKMALHKDYLRNWLRDQQPKSRFSFEEVWRLREDWIRSLSVAANLPNPGQKKR